MPGITDSQCDQKWRNLKKKHWKKYVDGQKKTEHGKKPKSEFLTKSRTFYKSAVQ